MKSQNFPKVLTQLGHPKVFLKVQVQEQQVMVNMLICRLGYDDALIAEQYLKLIREV